MNASTMTYARAELRPWLVAAAVLLLTLLALPRASAAAEHVAKAAKLTPIAAPATAPSPQSAAADSRNEALGPGDAVHITVFRNPDLTTDTKVTEKGTVLFPLIGEVQVSGLTASQAGQRIAEKLRSGKFVVNPEVTVGTTQVNSRQVSVLGNVNKPGRYPLDTATGKLTDLLALAGGVAPGGSDQVTLVTTRNGKTTTTDIDLPSMLRAGDLSKNFELQAGDTIFVHRAPMVYIYGEVQKGGAYRLEKDMTVMQVLAMGGGLTTRGTQRGIRIERKDGEAVRQIDAKLSDRVKGDDVIYVRESLF
jgi:polysaccharide export outer membrane protein